MERVLLVEDDDFTRMLLGQMIESLGFHCDAVRGALEARSAWEKHEYDFALLDLDLGSGPSGIDLARALRQSGARAGIAILTTYADPRLMGNLPDLPPDVPYCTKQSVDSPDKLADILQSGHGDLVDSQVDANYSADALSDSQVEMLRLLSAGCSNAELGKRLWLSQPGVEKALARLATRLGIAATSAENRRVLLVKEYYRMASGTDGPRA